MYEGDTPYSYGLNNPILFADPSGMSAQRDIYLDKNDNGARGRPPRRGHVRAVPGAGRRARRAPAGAGDGRLLAVHAPQPRLKP